MKQASSIDRDFFNQYTEGYSIYHNSDLDLILLKLLKALQGRRIRWACEIGCADGQFSKELQRHMPQKASFIGLDIADHVLKKYPFHQVCGNVFQCPCLSESIELVLCPASFHHLEPFEQALAEISRILSPNGLIYFLEPNFFHPQRRFFMTQKWLYHHYRRANDVPVNPEDLKWHLSKHKIKILSFQYINLRFRNPGILQKIQTAAAGLPWPPSLIRYIMPWFIMIGIKMDATTAIQPVELDRPHEETV